ncbi:MAG: 1-deoxy-D-xylulose-5-phosphate reductoisomerase [Oligoflexia bacterium]|nr:1-deoxy-D-xylulose-5-phosphate reductoisomerase [Oligoflexia bacterium]
MNIVILGSTGSIGESTLEVVRKSQGKIKVTALCAHSNLEKLNKQAEEFNVKHVVLTSKADSIKKLNEIVCLPEVDAVVVAIVGFAAVLPTLAALKAGKRVALANKEALVTCGEILTKVAAQANAQIIPVDSEHNALFQALLGHPKENVKKLWLTGSGGPFRGKTKAELKDVSVAQALKHPNWKMGAKITIDSATLMNKGLEFIEARWVFNLDPERIDVLIHPQSIIHGLVEFIDGCQLAHMSQPDMKAAISFALYYPKRQNNAVEPIDLVKLKKLEFEAVDTNTFKCFELAKASLKTGGVAPTVLNAANEIAVDAFLKEKISFLAIPELINSTLSRAPHQALDLDNLFEIDQWSRQKTLENISSL